MTASRNPKLRFAALAAAGLIALAGCGGDDEGAPIPADAVSALNGQLDSIQGRYDVGGAACMDIVTGDDTNVAVVESTIDGLPADVDPDVRSALQQSFERLFGLVDDDCAASADQGTDTAETTETAPLPETETQTETVPPDTDTETTPPDTDTETAPDFPPDSTGPPEDVPGQGNGLDGTPGMQDGGAQSPEEDG